MPVKVGRQAGVRIQPRSQEPGPAASRPSTNDGASAGVRQPPDVFSAPLAPATQIGEAPSAPAAAPRGPRPDYAPIAGVVVHALLRELSPPLFRALNELRGLGLGTSSQGFAGPQAGYSDTTLVWTRDYQPQFVRGADGETRVVTTLALNPARSGLAPTADAGMGSFPGRDPDTHLYREPGQSVGGKWLKSMHLPLLHEGGNLVSTGDHAFVTAKLLDDNSRERRDDHLLAAGYRPRGREEVLQLFAEGIGLAPSQVVVLDAMPGERTRHADLFLMALGPRRVMIPQVTDEAIDAVGYGHEKQLGRKVQGFLDRQAGLLRALGYQVERLPMLAPVYLTETGNPDEPWEGQFFSPANSLLANTGTEKHVLLPCFDARGFPESYRALNERYQQEWARFFEAEGWSPKLVDATSLGRAYGLIRCVTAPVPPL